MDTSNEPTQEHAYVKIESDTVPGLLRELDEILRRKDQVYVDVVFRDYIGMRAKPSLHVYFEPTARRFSSYTTEEPTIIESELEDITIVDISGGQEVVVAAAKYITERGIVKPVALVFDEWVINGVPTLQIKII